MNYDILFFPVYRCKQSQNCTAHWIEVLGSFYSCFRPALALSSAFRHGKHVP